MEIKSNSLLASARGVEHLKLVNIKLNRNGHAEPSRARPFNPHLKKITKAAVKGLLAAKRPAPRQTDVPKRARRVTGKRAGFRRNRTTRRKKIRGQVYSAR